MTDVTKELEAEKSKVVNYQRQIQDLTAELKSAKDMLSEAFNTQLTLRKSMAMMESQVTAYQHELKTMQNEINELKADKDAKGLKKAS